MPTDPLLNEARILAALRDEFTPLTPNGLRSLISITLLACYDRKVDREFFAELLDLNSMLNIDLSDLESAGRLRTLYSETHPDKEPKALDEQINKIATGFAAKRRRLATQFALVTECPTTTDRVS